MHLMAMSLKLNSVIRVAKVITVDAERGPGVVGPQRAALSCSSRTTSSITRGPAGLSSARRGVRPGIAVGMIPHVAGEESPGPAHTGRDAATLARWSHRHRDVSGGWLRPTVFGAVDGLVTNASLIAGVGGGGVSAHTVVLTGVAALVAGAFSMGTGEYVSVTNQNELVHAEVDLERRMLARFPAIEQDELAGYFRGYGADDETAARMAAAVSRDPDTALLVHTKEELGVDPRELPSPLLAGAASLAAFSLGALIPLLPYLLGAPYLAVALGITAVALAAGGMAVGRITGRPLLRSGLRQLALGGVAVAVTYGVGVLIGAQAH
jgi:VIT1/CCC1 family predicted Fe2+/Mn2+ transporter